MVSTSTSPPLGFVPAATPPPGVTPNFEHPRDYLYTINLANTWVCLGLVILFGGIRAYVKMTVKGWRGHVLFEDYCFILAWALCIFEGTGILLLSHYGEGYHLWELSQDEYREFRKWLYVCTVVYIPGAYFTKVALLLLIARVFSVQERVARGLKCFMVALGIGYIPIQVSKVVVCTPISAYWVVVSKGQKPGDCLNQNLLFLTDICVALATDVLILVVPIPLVLSLRMMPLWRKIRIIGMLSAGGAATATTAYRVVKIVQYMDSTDTTADFTALSIFTLLELSVGVICACLPSLNILIGIVWRGSASRYSANVPRTPGGLVLRPQHSSEANDSAERSTIPSDALWSTWSTFWARSLKLSSKSTAVRTVSEPAAGRDEEEMIGGVDTRNTGGPGVHEEIPGVNLDCDTELGILSSGEEDLGHAHPPTAQGANGDHEALPRDEGQV